MSLYVILQWFVLKGTFRVHTAQPPCNKQKHLQVDQVDQSPVQTDLNVSRDVCLLCQCSVVPKNDNLLHFRTAPSADPQIPPNKISLSKNISNLLGFYQ